jgi:hypothetical protein
MRDPTKGIPTCLASRQYGWLLRWRHSELRPDFRLQEGAPCRPPANAGHHGYRIAGSSSFPRRLAASPSLLRRSFLPDVARRNIRRLRGPVGLRLYEGAPCAFGEIGPNELPIAPSRGGRSLREPGVLRGDGRLLLIVAAHGGRILDRSSFSMQGAQRCAKSAATTGTRNGRKHICSAVYLPTGFSRWPPNWKRIAERSLFW